VVIFVLETYDYRSNALVGWGRPRDVGSGGLPCEGFDLRCHVPVAIERIPDKHVRIPIPSLLRRDLRAHPFQRPVALAFRRTRDA
jgi:hypothetical protein